MCSPVINPKVPYSGSSLTPRWVGLRDEPDYGGAFMFRGEPWFMVDSREGGNPGAGRAVRDPLLMAAAAVCGAFAIRNLGFEIV